MNCARIGLNRFDIDCDCDRKGTVKTCPGLTVLQPSFCVRVCSVCVCWVGVCTCVWGTLGYSPLHCLPLHL